MCIFLPTCISVFQKAYIVICTYIADDNCIQTTSLKFSYTRIHYNIFECYPSRICNYILLLRYLERMKLFLLYVYLEIRSALTVY